MQVGSSGGLIFQHLARFRQHQDGVISCRSKPTDAYGESHLKAPAYRGAMSAAVERLCQRAWFCRKWVIQEKVVSRQAIICCGFESATWAGFFHSMGLTKGLMDRPIRGLDYQVRAYQIHKLGPSANSRAVLKYRRDGYVIYPKDRVYGMLGLLKPSLIQVDYELDILDIYRSFTMAFIEESGSIDLANSCGTKYTLPGLPSRVPYFNARRSSCHPPGLFEITPDMSVKWLDNYRRLSQVLLGLRFRNGGENLVVKDKAVMKVRAVVAETPIAMNTQLAQRNSPGSCRHGKAFPSTIPRSRAPTQAQPTPEARCQMLLLRQWLLSTVSPRVNLTVQTHPLVVYSGTNDMIQVR